jgi:hypothetical protein
MDKLIFPQGCIVEGTIESIKYGGDIELHTHLPSPQIVSGQGNIVLQMSEADFSGTVLQAPEGQFDADVSSLQLTGLEAGVARIQSESIVKLDHADVSGKLHIKADQLEAASLKMQSGEFEVREANTPALVASGSLRLYHDQGQYQLDQVKAGSVDIHAESLTLNALEASGEASIEVEGEQTLQTRQIKAGSLVLKAKEFYGEELIIDGEATLQFEKGKLKEVRATAVKISGGFECEKLVVTEKVVVTSGFVHIRELDCPEFIAEPDVMGIVMVANTDKVVAQGVRGFLRPDEVSFLSNNVGEPVPVEPSTPVEAVASDVHEAVEESAEVEAEAVEELTEVEAEAVEELAEVEDEPEAVEELAEVEDEPEAVEESAEVEAEAIEVTEEIPTDEVESFEEPSTDEDGPGEVEEITEVEPAQGADAFDTPTESFEDPTVGEEESEGAEVEADTVEEEPPTEDFGAFDLSPSEDASEIDNPFARSTETSGSSGLDDTDPDVDAFESAPGEDEIETVDEVTDFEDVEATDFESVDDIDDEEISVDDISEEDFSDVEAIEEVGDNTFDSVSDSLDDAESIEDSGHFEVDAADLEDFDDEDLSVDTTDLDELPTVESFDESEDFGETVPGVQEEELSVEPVSEGGMEELSADDLYNVDDSASQIDAPVESIDSVEDVTSGGPAPTAEVVDFSEEEMAHFLSPEMSLHEQLDRILVQIKDLFPDDNYPKFIDQIQNYVAEERFSILIKTRNKEAVMGSFNKLDHPEISRLAKAFYDTLEAGYSG